VREFLPGICALFLIDRLTARLGDVTRVVELEVFSPASKTIQALLDVPLDRTIRVVEDEFEVHVLARSNGRRLVSTPGRAVSFVAIPFPDV